jgi:hypothetical protein
MKKMILFVLIIAAELYAQPGEFQIFNGFNDFGSSIPMNYEDEADALFDRMTVQPDNVRKALINQLIIDLKNAGLWSKFDCFWMFASHTSQAAFLNWIKTLHNATAVNSPTFTIDKGYAGNGTTSYINSNFTPSTQGVNYTLNNASFGIYLRSSVAAAARCDMGVFNTSANRWSELVIRDTGDLIVSAVNSGVTTSGANAATTGLFAASRVINTTQRVYRNGVQIDSEADASNALNSSVFAILARYRGDIGSADLFSLNQVAFAFIASDLSTEQQLTLFNLIEAYLDAIGAGVM